MHLANNFVFTGCFVCVLALGLPARAQDTSARAGVKQEDCLGGSEKSTLPASRPKRKLRQYYMCRRWGHNVWKRKREHCIGSDIGQALLIPVEIVGYALQDYNGSSTSPILIEILGGAVGCLLLSCGMIYLGGRHEAHHPQKFLSTLAVATGKTKHG